MNFSLTQTASKTGFLRSKDHTPLFFRHYPLSSPKATVVLIHGFGEHSGRYAHVVERLLKDNFEVFSLDLRGHGRSEGRRGDTMNFSNYEDDVITGLEHVVKNQDKSKKIFMIAHSMGALISLRVVMRTQFKLDGIVLSCPLLGLPIDMPSWKKWALFAGATLLPTFRLTSSIKGNQLSHDEKMAQAYDADPLVLKSISLRTFWEIYKSYQSVSYLASRMSLSFLMQIGGRDQVVDVHAAQAWFRKVNATKVDATLKIYPEFLHEIYNEADRHIPIEDALTWLNARSV